MSPRTPLVARMPLISRTLLIATRAFDDPLGALRVAEAIERGISAGGWQTDLCPITLEREQPGDVRALLDALDFDARMRASRAVILGERRLREDTLAGSVAFEIATRARQAGVPAYAVTGENRLDAFDARILDLQAILEASSARGLAAAGKKLAALL
jgi:glycerate kinase